MQGVRIATRKFFFGRMPKTFEREYYGDFVHGGIEVVCGPMFSGKTEELIRRVRRAQIARQKVQILNQLIQGTTKKQL